MLTFEKISLDSIFKKQSWYICRISPERPRHEMLLTRGKVITFVSLVKRWLFGKIKSSQIEGRGHWGREMPMSLTTAPNSVLGYLLPCSVAWEQWPGELPLWPCCCGGAPWFRVSMAAGFSGLGIQSDDPQFCTTPDDSPQTPYTRFRFIKVHEVEPSFHLGGKEYSWGRCKAWREGTWNQNGEGFIWAQYSEPVCCSQNPE